ncbi:hypothetical protein CANARDRAFT_30315 [[Candida] arabinofermentans NRRL YB-2248]|uniref:Small ribosomal subunit protein uS9m n=1 Tax=[Candida] arabinofermentans NRRL YB-2248 TaxID=983967 RepID=A0A1E4SUC6_9ASCO|nr:hypothetical protein CANARDRAFT_30315 [[Candida] arabinofermentans NRRL YB-2248]
MFRVSINRLVGVRMPATTYGLSTSTFTSTTRFFSNSSSNNNDRRGRTNSNSRDDTEPLNENDPEPHLKFKSFNKYYADPTLVSKVPELERTRIVPTLTTSYSRNPYHQEHISKLTEVLNKYLRLPFDKKRSSSKSWLSFQSYQYIAGGELLTEIEHQRIVNLLRRLDSIEPDLKTTELEEVLAPYRDTSQQGQVERKIPELDDLGRAVAIGRRKSSSAKAYVVKGTGEILINDQPLDTIFPKLQDRMRIMYPLQVVRSENLYNVFAVVRGGGSTGQVDAVKLAISRALTIHNPLFRPRLFSAGCLTRDKRVVERKKAGRVKARKMPTWVKR